MLENFWVQVLIKMFMVFIGVGIGSKFADIDLAPPLPIRHRSFWTHGLFIPLGLGYLLPMHPLMFWFTVGFLPAFALHLLADMFPKRWRGGAMIKLYPIPITLPAPFSLLWLCMGMLWAGKMFFELVWFSYMGWPLPDIYNLQIISML